MNQPTHVHQYGRFELSLQGPADGSPFVEVEFGAAFTRSGREIRAAGFYDGEGVYKVRFMPDAPGEWRYRTYANRASLDGKTGAFTCVDAPPGARGPVRVANQYHFEYADGTPYLPFGTTCYAWVHQGQALELQTLETLRKSPFNKLRMCVFPKHYRFNENEPELYPFERGADGQWDFTRFRPDFFRHLEQRVAGLGALGIEADLILFHPYDRWGFANMGRAADDRYLHYIVARLAAYANVWWSLANEYDIMREKTMEDWDRFFQVVAESDPYGHLRSVHNWQRLEAHDSRTFYDHRKPWVTHCSVQHSFVDQVGAWREQYGKPVVVDECCYEGNIPNGWGNITGQELTRRFWECTVQGGYGGHGETFLDPEDVLWWSKGGRLRGESPARIAFLRKILESLQPGGLELVGRISDTHLASAGRPGECYLTYFGVRQPGQVTFTLPEDTPFSASVIDTWEMTITSLPGVHSGTFTLPLPSFPYHAVLLRKAAV
jgi:hypothetical protein